MEAGAHISFLSIYKQRGSAVSLPSTFVLSAFTEAATSLRHQIGSAFKSGHHQLLKTSTSEDVKTSSNQSSFGLAGHRVGGGEVVSTDTS